MTMPLAELQHLERTIEKHLGHYNGSISWYLQHRPEASPETIADMIADRDSSAMRKMTGGPGYVCDRDAWRPTLVAAVSAMLQEIADGP